MGLVSLLALVGGGHQIWHTADDFSPPALWITEVTSRIVSGIRWVLMGGVDPDPWGLRIVCAVLVVAFLHALRRAMIMYNAYKPGAVDVRKLVDATVDGQPHPPVEDLTAQLRKSLSESNLYPPTVVPAEAPAESFLDLVGDIDLEPKKLGTSMLRLFSRLRPKLAYQISGVLRVREPEPRFGMTVTVTSYATRGSHVETVWGRTWEQTVHRAGYWVMATLVPVIRAGRELPWRGWQGRSLPVDLFEAYQEATELARGRRFDEALSLYYKAVQLDPTNLFLRVQIGLTQEKLGLYLDALETYHGALVAAGQTTERATARLWALPEGGPPIACLRYLRRHPGALQARQRYAIVLGTSELTAHQWCKRSDDGFGRPEIRRQIRESLTPDLVDRYWRTAVDLVHWDEDPLTDAVERDVRERLSEVFKTGDESEVALVFQRACLAEAYRLSEDYLIARCSPRIRRGEIATTQAGIITQASVRMFRDIWAPLRLALAWDAYHDHHLSETGPGSFAGPPLPPAEALGWSDDFYREVRKMVRSQVSPEELRWRVRQAKHDWRRLIRKDWQENYNAACLYALAMKQRIGRYLGWPEEFSALAVRELKKAVRREKTGFVKITRSWMLTDDPDLAPLRAHGAFIRFEREVYPYATHDHLRPQDIPPTRIEITDYYRRLLTGIATAMRGSWDRRPGRGPVGIATVTTWLQNERELWGCVHHLACSQARNWLDRRSLIEKTRRVADPAVLGDVDISSHVSTFDEIFFSRPDDPWLTSQGAQDAVERIPGTVDGALERLESMVDGADPRSPVKHIDEWLEVLRKADETGTTTVRAAALRSLCARHAALWQALCDEVNEIGDGSPQPAFADALERLPAPSVPTRLLISPRTVGFRPYRPVRRPSTDRRRREKTPPARRDRAARSRANA
ncbi:tetratricopeptide repeat protein [Planomonospora corallina]|uniref:tetratricopeptide repeat protein n=1 Tax=Planomonospora corallina TaxID=1806052 RepID=UPI0036713D22